MKYSFSGDPSGDPSIDGDPFKTLFVGRIVSEFTKIIAIYNCYENINYFPYRITTRLNRSFGVSLRRMAQFEG